MVGLVWVALDEQDVLTVQSSFDKLLEYCKIYFGITNDNKYTTPGIYLGYTEANNSEFESDYKGFFKFFDNNIEYKIFIFQKQLDEICM